MVTAIGNGTLIMAYAHIAHDCIVGAQCVIGNNAQLAGDIKVEDRAIISGMVGIHHFATIGERAFVGGMSSVRFDIPPFLIADGHPLASSLEIEILCPPKARDLLGLRALTLKQVGTSGGHKWEQTELPRHASDGLLSLGNSGPLAKSRQIVCIHDMNTRLFPSSYSKRFRLLYGALLPALGRRAAAR